MHLDGQVIIAIEQLDQERKTPSLFGYALAAEPVLAKLLTDHIESLASKRTVQYGCGPVRMISNHPAFTNVSWRRGQPE
ncbi:hypothetical protein D1872_281570 [compost metagenome]